MRIILVWDKFKIIYRVETRLMNCNTPVKEIRKPAQRIHICDQGAHQVLKEDGLDIRLIHTLSDLIQSMISGKINMYNFIFLRLYLN